MCHQTQSIYFSILWDKTEKLFKLELDIDIQFALEMHSSDLQGQVISYTLYARTRSKVCEYSVQVFLFAIPKRYEAATYLAIFMSLIPDLAIVMNNFLRARRSSWDGFWSFSTCTFIQEFRLCITDCIKLILFFKSCIFLIGYASFFSRPLSSYEDVI